MKKQTKFIIFFLLLPFFIYSQSVNDSLKVNLKPLVTLTVKDIDVRDLVNGLGTKYNLNIFVDNSIKERISFHVVDVDINTLLDFIAEEKKLILTKKGNIYRFGLPPKPVKKPREIFVKYENGLLTADFKQDKLNIAMRAVADAGKKTILLDKTASGNISGFIRKVPFDIGLKQILINNGYRLRIRNSIYTIYRDSFFQDGKEGQQQKRSGKFRVDIEEDSLLTIEAYNAPIEEIIQQAAQDLNESVFIYGKIEGTISGRANGLTFPKLLTFLFQGSEYTYKKQNDIILIGDRRVKGIASSEMIELNYIKADKVLEMLPKEMVSKAEIKPIIEQNGIMVIGTQSTIQDIKNYIKEIDLPSPQILIEVLVVDINNSKFRELEMEAGYGGGSGTDSSAIKRRNTILPGIDILFTGGDINKVMDRTSSFLGINKIGKLPTDFFLRVKALEGKNIAKIYSKPQIATLNGCKADVSIGYTQYYKLKTSTPMRDPNQVYVFESEKFETIEANVSLEITPWVSGSGEITVEIHPDFREPSGTFDGETLPTIQTRSLNSTVRLKDGETIVLGGLVRNYEIESETGIPILKDIPLLGWLFKSTNYRKEKAELLIYVTPHLYYHDE